MDVFFIQKIIEGVKFIDLSDLIAESLHMGLIVVNNCAPFFLSSYLIYILKESKEWESLLHTPWIDGISIYQYYNDLQETTLCKEFKMVNDVFLGKLVFELQVMKMIECYEKPCRSYKYMVAFIFNSLDLLISEWVVFLVSL